MFPDIVRRLNIPKVNRATLVQNARTLHLLWDDGTQVGKQLTDLLFFGYTEDEGNKLLRNGSGTIPR
jgi:hypothetical protein